MAAVDPVRANVAKALRVIDDYLPGGSQTKRPLHRDVPEQAELSEASDCYDGDSDGEIAEPNGGGEEKTAKKKKRVSAAKGGAKSAKSGGARRLVTFARTGNDAVPLMRVWQGDPFKDIVPGNTLVLAVIGWRAQDAALARGLLIMASHTRCKSVIASPGDKLAPWMRTMLETPQPSLTALREQLCTGAKYPALSDEEIKMIKGLTDEELLDDANVKVAACRGVLATERIAAAGPDIVYAFLSFTLPLTIDYDIEKTAARLCMKEKPSGCELELVTSRNFAALCVVHAPAGTSDAAGLISEQKCGVTELQKPRPDIPGPTVFNVPTAPSGVRRAAARDYIKRTFDLTATATKTPPERGTKRPAEETAAKTEIAAAAAPAAESLRNVYKNPKKYIDAAIRAKERGFVTFVPLVFPQTADAEAVGDLSWEELRSAMFWMRRNKFPVMPNVSGVHLTDDERAGKQAIVLIEPSGAALNAAYFGASHAAKDLLSIMTQALGAGAGHDVEIMRAALDVLPFINDNQDETTALLAAVTAHEQSSRAEVQQLHEEIAKLRADAAHGKKTMPAYILAAGADDDADDSSEME